MDRTLLALDEACEIVGSLITNHRARLWVTIETGFDESGLIGTADAYLRLAAAALDLVRTAGRKTARVRELGGSKLPVSADFYDVFGPAEVRITGGWLASSEREVTAGRAVFGDTYGAEPDAEPGAAADAGGT